MGIHKYDVYRSPNIGIFLKANDKFLFVPKGFANSKIEKLEGFLDIKCVNTSIAHTRLLGPLMVVNNQGIVVPRITEDEEVRDLKKATGMNVVKLETKLTAVGNLIVANDKAAIASRVLPKEMFKDLQDILGVPVECMNVASYHQVGAVIVSTNVGAAVHPKASEKEIEMIKNILNVEVEPVTVNGGVPYVGAGMVGNSRSIVVGSLTTGPELIMLTRAFKV
ncbi:MAG: translation initiation factor IF-6 [Nitrososphaerales archaeon]